MKKNILGLFVLLVAISLVLGGCGGSSAAGKKALYEEACIGSISEIYDAKSPQMPKGAIAQAWSISEILRIVLG